MYTLTDKRLAFRPDLQGLRAVAILLVLFAHAGWAIAPGGFIGVDVFFVLSGYLITGLLFRELEENGHIAFLRFYARRLKRLLPALIFMLCISVTLAIWVLSAVEARAQLASSPFAAFWSSNLYFAFTTLDYFDELASRDLFLHTWSLGVEEQFYLVWPIVLLLIWKRKPLVTARGKNIDMMLTWLGLIGIASLALSLYWTENTPQAAFYLMPSRIWQFSLGAMVYLKHRNNPSNRDRAPLQINNTTMYLALGMGLFFIVGSAVGLDRDRPYPGIWALIPSFGAALVIGAGHAMHESCRNPLAHPALVWLGDRSYSLYLWHWPIFLLGFSMGFQGNVFSSLVLMLISLLAAIVSYRFVELPFWKGRLSHSRPLHIVLVSLLIMASVILVFYHGLRQFPQQGTTADMSNKWRMDVPVIYRMHCDAWYTHARVEPCVLGEETAEKTVVLLGDSIGAQWFSLAPGIFQKPRWRTVVLTKSSCPMVDEDFYYKRIGQNYQVCTDWRNALLDELDKLKPDVIIMGSASTYGFSEAQWVEGTSRILERLSNTAKTVFVIPGTPNLGFDGPGCISRNFAPDTGSIDREACLGKSRMQHIGPVSGFLGQAANHFANVHLLDLNDLVCPGGDCYAVNEKGVVVFRDSQHLTDSFVQSQIPLVRDRVRVLYEE